MQGYEIESRLREKADVWKVNDLENQVSKLRHEQADMQRKFDSTIGYKDEEIRQLKERLDNLIERLNEHTIFQGLL